MRVLKFLFAVMSAVLICSCSEDEVSSFGNITGLVTDASTGEPITNAVISLSPTNLSAQADASGSFGFYNLDPGSYTVQVKATGYSTTTTQVTVVVGSTSKCDVKLTSTSQQSSIALSASTVTFDKGVSELTFTISNTASSGSVSWSISGITVDWLTVLPRTGTVAHGASSTVKLTIDRTKISNTASSVNTSFIVEGSSFSQAVNVVVNNVTTSGNSGTGTSGGSGTTTGSDTSSAKITSLNSDIKAEIISCKRNDDVVTLDFRLTNNGSKSYSAYFNQVDGKKTVIWTDDNQQYYEWTLNFNGTTSKYDVNTTIPESAPCNGYVKISGVSSSAKILNVSIYVNGNFDSNNLKFLNVPIN